MWVGVGGKELAQGDNGRLIATDALFPSAIHVLCYITVQCLPIVGGMVCPTPRLRL